MRIEKYKMKQYIVDTFTDKLFSGNPAAVCMMESWPSEESMSDDKRRLGE